MYYISPFTLLETGGRVPGATELPVLIREARKRHIVNAQLSPDGLVEVGERQLSKNDVLQLLDELKDPFSYNLHAAIYRQQQFCVFLENGTPGHVNWEVIRRLPGNELFLPFVRPYFIQRMVDAHVSALRSHDAAKMWALREIRIPRRDEVLDVFYDRLLDIVYSDLEQLRNRIDHSNDPEQLREALRFTGYEAISTWNALPSEMEGVRDDLAECFAKLYTNLQRQNQVAHLDHLATQAQRLSCGNTGKLWQNRIARMHEAFAGSNMQNTANATAELSAPAEQEVSKATSLTETLITAVSVMGLTWLLLLLLK